MTAAPRRLFLFAGVRYGAVVLLALAAQLARLPLHPPTLIPFITYVPFVVLGACLGLGPGLLNTALCVAECAYWATEPPGSFTVSNHHDWLGLLLPALTGIAGNSQFEWLRRSRAALRVALDEVEAGHSLLDAVFSAQTDGLVVCNALGNIVRTNPAAEKYFGFEPAGTNIARFFERFPLEGGLNSSLTWRALHGETNVCAEQKAGERVLETSSVPMWDESGHLTGAVTISRDVTTRKRAQEDLRRQHSELLRQAELINLSHDAIITAGRDRVIRGWNRGAEEMYGWPASEAVGRRVSSLLATVSSIPLAEIDQILGSEGRWEGELRHLGRDGAQIFVDSRQIRLHGEGEAGGILEINRDLTPRRRAEDEVRRTVRKLESALAEKTILLKEVHHRVKNNLAVISSLLSLKAETVANDEARIALSESQQRVHSMALVHEHLYGSEHLDRINFAEYAQQLVRWLQASLNGIGGHISIEMDVDPIELEIERAVPCGLILNELFSNALKHAFRDRSSGKIVVSCRESGPGWITLAIEDDGTGLPEGYLAGGTTKSLGLRIVRILSKQLHGTLQAEPCAGTRVSLRFPSLWKEQADGSL
jgi:PAS domain S-box-containing protein